MNAASPLADASWNSAISTMVREQSALEDLNKRYKEKQQKGEKGKGDEEGDP